MARREIWTLTGMDRQESDADAVSCVSATDRDYLVRLWRNEETHAAWDAELVGPDLVMSLELVEQAALELQADGICEYQEITYQLHESWLQEVDGA